MLSIASDHMSAVGACFCVTAAMTHDITGDILCKSLIPAPSMHRLSQEREEVHQVVQRDQELPDLLCLS